MRKHLLIPTILAVAIIGFGANLTMANCGNCGSASAASSCSGKSAVKAEAGACSDHADMTAAECAAACAAKAAQASAADCATACAAKGAQASAGCASAASAASCAAEGDFFISNYIGLRAAMDKNCNHSMTSAAAAYRSGLQNIIASGQADEHREALTALSVHLADWPSEAKAQQARFGEISEWVASYCEMNPEKTAGAKVVTCPDSGHRWVEVKADGDKDQS